VVAVSLLGVQDLYFGQNKCCHRAPIRGGAVDGRAGLGKAV